jgi:hypothetical protein
MTACRRWSAVSLALAFCSAALQAQTRLDASVSIRSEVWSGNRLLDDRGALAAASAWGSARLDLGEAGALAVNGWLRTALQDDGARGGRVRELYWTSDLGPVSLRFGRQMIVWGRADGLNPTDNLAPRDFTLLTPEDGEQRHGNLALSLKWPAGPGALSLAWFPRGASHTIALPAVPGLHYTVQAPPSEAQWALKLDGTLGDVDGSVSYFDGADPWPDLSIVAASAKGVEVVLRNQRARILGADFSLARHGVVWRAEVAWLRTASEGADDFRHKRPQLWLVAGGEWMPRETVTLGLQLTARQVFDFSPADRIADPVNRAVARRQAAVSGQTAASQFGLLWRVASRLHDNRLAVEVSGVLLGPPRNGLLRAHADYALSDNMHLRAGLATAFGGAETTFGQLQPNGLVYLQLRVGLSSTIHSGR